MKNLEFRITKEVPKFSVLNFQSLILSFFLCGLGVLCGKASGGGLQFRFKPGDKYFLQYVIEYKTTQVVDGNEQATEQTMRLGCDLDIEEVDGDGCAWAKYTYRQAVLKAKGLGTNFEYDSDVSGQKVHVRALPLQTGLDEGFFMRITPQGRLSKINGLPAVISAAKSKIPANLAGRDAVFKAIEGWYSEDMIQRMLEEQLAVFPDPGYGSALRRDEANIVADDKEPNTWSHNERMNLRGSQSSILMQQMFVLKDSRDGIAYVDVNMSLSSDANSEETVRGGAKVRYKASGQGQGAIEIEESSGRIINSRLSWHVVESVEVSAQGPVLRLPPVSEPIHTYVDATFQMTRRE
jgi:hypothetical protein